MRTRGLPARWKTSSRKNTRARGCHSRSFDRETDILDVWFDSGVSYAAVIESAYGADAIADLYLEGSDQHRGWFHSALLEAVATRDRAPYKAVLTHGFVLDGDGRKMSKSLGNVVAPQKIVQQYGADILRLWVAAEDYRDDVRISDEIMRRLADSYRRIRNTARNLLANLYDFDVSRDRSRIRSADGVGSLGARALGGAGSALSRSVRSVRIPRRLPCAQQFLQRRHECAVLRHRQGSSSTAAPPVRLSAEARRRRCTRSSPRSLASLHR